MILTKTDNDRTIITLDVFELELNKPAENEIVKAELILNKNSVHYRILGFVNTREAIEDEWSEEPVLFDSLQKYLKYQVTGYDIMYQHENDYYKVLISAMPNDTIKFYIKTLEEVKIIEKQLDNYLGL